MVFTPSSSTLSPLAPPFTVDRPNATHRFQPYRYAPPPLPPPLIGDPLPAEFDRNALFDRQDSLPSESIGERSSWIDPSSGYSATPFQKGGAVQSFLAYRDAYGAWGGKHLDRQHHESDPSPWGGDVHSDSYEEKANDSCNNVSSYFPLPDSNLVMNECNNTSSNSSYDRYMSQLVSCSLDLNGQFYYPATCSSSTQVYTSANGTSSSVYPVARNGYSTTQDGNLLYKVDDNYVDHMLSKRKEPFSNEYSDSKHGFVKGNTVDNDMNANRGTVLINPAYSSFGDDGKHINSTDLSTEVKYGLQIEQLKLPDSYDSSSRSNSSTQTSRETIDQPNPAVDSPCWKGAVLSPFIGGEMIDRYPVRYPVPMEPKSSHNLDQGQNHLSTIGRYSRVSPCRERDDGLSCCDSMRETLSPPRNPSLNIILNGQDPKLFHRNRESGCTEIEKKDKNHFSFAVGKKLNEAEKFPEKDSQAINKYVKQSEQDASENSSVLKGSCSHVGASLTTAANVSSPNLNFDMSNHAMNLGICGGLLGQAVEPIDSTPPQVKPSGKDLLLLAKAMHNLSELFLSSSYNGGVELEECDGLARKIINNLETFLFKNEKGIHQNNSHAPCSESGHFPAAVSKTSDNVKIHSTSSEEFNGILHGVGSCTKKDKFDIWSSYRTSQQAPENTFEENIFEMKEENPRAELYKNLWMQAEAGLCSMKYELQLARMKLEAENYKCKAKAKEPVEALKSAGLDSMGGLNTSVCTNQEKICSSSSNNVNEAPGKSSEEKLKEDKPNKNGEIEDCIMARLEVLKARYNSNIEDQPSCLDTENSLKDLPAKLADLGFVDSGILQPFDGAGCRDVQNLAPKYIEENNNAWYEENPEHASGGLSYAWIAKDQLPQQFKPTIDPLRFVFG